MKLPIQWNCEGCEESGMLAPEKEPIMEKIGEMEVPETDDKGQLVFEVVDDKDEKGKPIKLKRPKMKIIPRMGNKMGKMKQQNPMTGRMQTVDVPQFKDLSTRIYLIQLRIGDEILTRYLCKGCLLGVKTEVKGIWNKLEGMNN